MPFYLRLEITNFSLRVLFYPKSVPSTGCKKDPDLRDDVTKSLGNTNPVVPKSRTPTRFAISAQVLKGKSANQKTLERELRFIGP